MDRDGAALARSLTRSASRQTYATARLLVDRDLRDDFFRAYAYMRWTDDRIDDPGTSRAERLSFIGRQLEMVDGCYRRRPPNGLSDEEQLIAAVILRQPDEEGKLASFVNNMLAIIEFDARRRGQLISDQELGWYIDSLSRSVTDGLQFFIGNGHSYPDSEDRYKAAAAAHITHLLRDTHEDVQNGFFNVPVEYLDSHESDPTDVSDPALRGWVRERLAMARTLFSEGKRYLDQIKVLRCKVAGYWYCARFESLLDRIEADDYELRPAYGRRQKLASSARMARETFPMVVRHMMPARLR